MIIDSSPSLKYKIKVRLFSYLLSEVKSFNFKLKLSERKD